VQLLGATLAVLSAVTFAVTNATGRRGVITGTPAQGMVISMPVGLACFLALAIPTGAVQGIGRFSGIAIASLSTAGVLHFVLGRYCNFRASQAAGVNLTAPVIQLNSVVTLVLAVVILREPCTLLQALGAFLMVAGSLVVQRPSTSSTESEPVEVPAFRPRIAVGFYFALIAALAYGTSPISSARRSTTPGP
jgi:drug/metabolite transporter (DMT)-like permease